MEREQWGSFALGAIVGAVIGGGVALLLAPKSGAETRAYLKAKFSDVGEKVGDKVSNIRHKMGEKISGEECAPTKEEG
jgi:gas vesicle protein